MGVLKSSSDGCTTVCVFFHRVAIHVMTWAFEKESQSGTWQFEKVHLENTRTKNQDPINREHFGISLLGFPSHGLLKKLTPHSVRLLLSTPFSLLSTFIFSVTVFIKVLSAYDVSSILRPCSNCFGYRIMKLFSTKYFVR